MHVCITDCTSITFYNLDNGSFPKILHQFFAEMNDDDINKAAASSIIWVATALINHFAHMNNEFMCN